MLGNTEFINTWTQFHSVFSIWKRTTDCEMNLVIQITNMWSLQMRNHREVSPKTTLKELHISM